MYTWRPANTVIMLNKKDSWKWVFVTTTLWSHLSGCSDFVTKSEVGQPGCRFESPQPNSRSAVTYRRKRTLFSSCSSVTNLNVRYYYTPFRYTPTLPIWFWAIVRKQFFCRIIVVDIHQNWPILPYFKKIYISNRIVVLL